MDRSTLNKVQHQFWVTKQTVYRKLGKKEDDCIVASDALLDAKLELFKSIQVTSSSMNKLLDRYQEKICFLAQEQNAMGRFLKEYGKQDKSGAGKMMIQMGKSLIYCSQQEISIRPALLRLYQEVETFRNRAVEDTLDTINSMERLRTEYRASLSWMKNVSQELDPDTYKQMEKFRKVQNQVKRSKAQFDKLKLACLQKVDLLAAARCNMFSHALIQYQTSMMKATGKNSKVFNTLAITFKGHQYYEFSVVKELVEPSKKLASENGSNEKEATDELLFDFNDDLAQKIENSTAAGPEIPEKTASGDLDMLGLNTLIDHEVPALSTGNPAYANEEDLLASASASELLENLLGGSSRAGESPETEDAHDALDLDLGLFSPLSGPPGDPGKDKEDSTAAKRLSISSLSQLGKSSLGSKKEKEKATEDLLTDELDGISMENNDTMTLLNEILSASSNNGLANFSGQPLAPNTKDPLIGDSIAMSSQSGANTTNPPCMPSSFLPSHLLDFSIDSGDLLGLSSSPLNFTAPMATPKADIGPQAVANVPVLQASSVQGSSKSWYDIFADLDPIANPDAVGKKESDEAESRYC